MRSRRLRTWCRCDPIDPRGALRRIRRALESQDAEVQHVGVGDQDVGGIGLDLPPSRAGCVAVVDRGAHRTARAGKGVRSRDHPAATRHRAGEILQPLQLILRQRLVGKQVQSAGSRPRERRLQGREEIDQALAARRRRDDEDVGAGAHPVDRLGLVIVESGDPEVAEGPLDGFGKGRRQRGVRRVLRGKGGGEDDVLPELLGSLDALDKGSDRIGEDSPRSGGLAASPRARPQRPVSRDPYS